MNRILHRGRVGQISFALLPDSAASDEILLAARRKGIRLLSDFESVLSLLSEKLWESIEKLDFDELEAEICGSAEKTRPSDRFRNRILSTIGQGQPAQLQSSFAATRLPRPNGIRERIIRRAGVSV